MNEQDLKIAGKISELISRFSAEWLNYQDWLRDIVSSYSVLQQRHPAWLAVTIFRWRLLYFVIYVGAIVMVNQLLVRLTKFRLKKDFVNFTTLLKKIAPMTKFLNRSRCLKAGSHRYVYILQRTATLLAVAELTLCAIAGFTGILLAFYYQPTALEAYESLAKIVNEVNHGSLVLSLHNLAGNSIIVLALVQIIVMFLGRQFLLPWLTAWISGICLLLTTIGLSWTAIVLNWGQTSFWRLKIELGIVASIPLLGSKIRNILLGGNSINTITVQHMYAMHSYILATAAVFLSITHLVALIYQEQSWKPETKRFVFTQTCDRPAVESNSSSV